MHPLIAKHREGIASVCRQYHIQRLEVFGSAARADDFDPAASDADFLVQFAPDIPVGLSDFFSAKADLEQLLGRPVDLVETSSIRNPYLRNAIDRCRELIYAA